MYEQFFGLTEPPFGVTPDPRFLFLASSHRDALDHLRFGIRQRRGFIVLTGEVGTGKTTLCRTLIRELGPECRTALILNPALSETQLLRAILSELGLDHAKLDKLGLRSALNRVLLDQAARGGEVVLIIDEAQNMSLGLLEQIRMLSNLETDRQKLLQIVLVGQPELRKKLNDPGLIQLRQRITVSYHLRPLARQDTEGYLHHRLRVAGATDTPAFDADAVDGVFRSTSGVPRLINAVGDRALLTAFVERSVRITRPMVDRAVSEMEALAV